MKSTVIQGIVILAIPVLVFIAGTKLLEKFAERDLSKAPTPIGLRVCGYNADDAKAYWKSVGPEAEQWFLELDLLFPFLYGGAMLVALFLAWNRLHRPFSIWFLIVPVLLLASSDWTENIGQLHELKHFCKINNPTVSNAWIRLASTGTTLKWTLGTGCLIFLICLLVWMICMARSTTQNG